MEKAVHAALQAGIGFQDRRERMLDPRQACGQQLEELGRGHDDRSDRDVGDREKQDDAHERRERRRHAPALEPFEQRHQRHRHHQE